MSYKARRVIRTTAVTPFEWARWGTDTAPEPLAAPSPEPVVEPPSIEAIAREHANHFEALERDAFAKGFAQGERAGAEASGERAKATLRRLTETLEELTSLRTQMIRATEIQLVQLSLAIAKRVVRREVSLDHDLLIAIARVALERLGDSASVTVRLNPADFAATVAVRASEWDGTNVNVVSDAHVPPGGCRVESDLGVLDAGVDAQMTEIARALLGEDVDETEQVLAR